MATPPPRPTTTLIPGWQDNIPAEMKALSQWANWYYKFVDGADGKPGRHTKVPVYFVGGKNRRGASTTDRTTWTTWSKAETATRLFVGHARADLRLDGQGFVFSTDDEYVGVDFDKAIENGVVMSWAQAWLDRLGPTYIEVSPSGTGFKGVWRGSLPPKGKADGRKRDGYGPDGKGAIEAYHRERFFTITGNVLYPGQCGINTPPEGALEALVAELDARPGRKAKTTTTRKATPPPTIDLGDSALLEKACNQAGKGDEFRRLYYDGVREGEDHSAADYSLINDLLFWCGPDEARVDRLFRASALFRSKWADRSDYGPNTIQNAIATRSSGYYDPGHRSPGPSTNGERSRNGDDDHGRPPPTTKATDREYVLANHELGDEGRMGRKVRDIGNELRAITDGWPKRIGKRLFCRDAAHEPVYLASPDCLFGWVLGHCQVDWKARDKVPRAVPQGQFYEHLKMDSEKYDDLELMPHEPQMEGTYYLHRPLPAPSGPSKLDELLSRLCPETPQDLELMRAMLLTLFWGGRPGKRPAFLITGTSTDAEQGRGVGKSTLTEILAIDLAGGCIEVGARDDLNEVKTRLLSATGCHKRVARVDNLKSEKFSWSDLEGFITAPMISGRQLYEGEGQRKNVLVWLITVNGANLSKDMAQRVVPIRLSRPAKYGADWDEKFRTFIQEHRWAIIAEVIALLRTPSRTLKRSTRWASWEHNVLSKVGMAEECQQLIAERQGEFDADEDEKDAIIDAIELRLRRYPHVDPIDCCFFIPSNVMAGWVNEACGTKDSSTRITPMLNRLAIPELKWSKRGNGPGRGFIWRGANVPANATPDLLPPDPTGADDRRGGHKGPY